MIGFTDKLPKSTIEAINNAKEKTANNTGLKNQYLQLIMVAEQNLFIVLKNMFDELHQQGLNSDIIDETYINNHLMTKDYPDPKELLIYFRRTKRKSIFLFASFV